MPGALLVLAVEQGCTVRIDCDATRIRKARGRPAPLGSTWETGREWTSSGFDVCRGITMAAVAVNPARPIPSRVRTSGSCDP